MKNSERRIATLVEEHFNQLSSLLQRVVHLRYIEKIDLEKVAFILNKTSDEVTELSNKGLQLLLASLLQTGAGLDEFRLLDCLGKDLKCSGKSSRANMISGIVDTTLEHLKALSASSKPSVGLGFDLDFCL